MGVLEAVSIGSSILRPTIEVTLPLFRLHTEGIAPFFLQKNQQPNVGTGNNEHNEPHHLFPMLHSGRPKKK